MNVIVIIVPAKLVTNLYLLLCFYLFKTKSKNQIFNKLIGVVTKNVSVNYS